MAIIQYSTMLPIEAFGGIVWSLYAVAFLTTALRLYARAYITKAGIGLDDCLVVGGMIMTVASIACSYVSCDLFIDIYEKALDGADFVNQQGQPIHVADWNVGFRYGVLMGLFYYLALAAAKCSILAFYCRIRSMCGQCRFLYALMAVIAIHAIITFALYVAAFIPTESIWNMYNYDTANYHYRFYPPTVALIYTCFHVLFDLIILAIPLPFLLRMKLRRSKKVGLLSVYSVSLLSLGLTIVRLVECVDFFFADVESDQKPYQVFISRIFYSLWTMLEVITVILVANLPALYALWKRFSDEMKTRNDAAPYFVFSAIGRTFRDAPRSGRKMSTAEEERAELERRFDESAANFPGGEYASKKNSDAGIGHTHHVEEKTPAPSECRV